MNGYPLLRIQNLCFSYNSSPILQQVNLEIQSGDALALVGPNGAGKTTLLNIIGGTLTPSQGRVCLTGVDLSGLRPKERAKLVAMVPQNPSVPRGFTALEMVLMGRNAHLRLLQWEGSSDVEKCQWAMELTDTWGLADRSIWSLSGGERQRVFIARALAQESQLLLLDEPTANLDIGYQPAMLDMMARIRREVGVTVVAAMHDLTLAAQYFPKMAVLYKGSVFASGSPEEVLRPGVVETAFGTSVYLTRHPIHHTPVVLPVGDTNESRTA